MRASVSCGIAKSVHIARFPSIFHSHTSTSRTVPFRRLASMASSALKVTVEPIRADPSTIPENASDLAHHRPNGGFRNPWDSVTMRKPNEIMLKFFRRKLTGQARTPDISPPHVPVHKPFFLPTRETATLRATWLGHACFLAEFPSGVRVLFDPVLAQRASPFSWLGPSRVTPAPCKVADIPHIDAVVISHNHYDHLCHATIKEVQRLHPQCHFFVPLGNKKWFADSGVDRCTELDWWQSARLRVTDEGADESKAKDMEATIGCLPAQHGSARSTFDRDQALWASWSVHSGGASLYFAGDTGYRAVPDMPEGEDDYGEKWADLPRCPAFKDIGRLRGPFDLGLLPIGAYSARWLLSTVHANPTDAVNIMTETRCKRALAMHWGTWALGEEDFMEPPKLLAKALEKYGYASKGVFDICDIGASTEVPLEKNSRL